MAQLSDPCIRLWVTGLFEMIDKTTNDVKQIATTNARVFLLLQIDTHTKSIVDANDVMYMCVIHTKRSNDFDVCAPLYADSPGRRD